MHLSLAKSHALLSGEKLSDEDEPAAKDALPALNSESLSTDYPDWAPSLFALVKNTESELGKA